MLREASASTSALLDPASDPIWEDDWPEATADGEYEPGEDVEEEPGEDVEEGPAEADTPRLRVAAGEAEGIRDPIRPPRPALAIGGSVGRGGRNQAADVTAVQERLIELRVLDRTEAATERPAPGTAGESLLSRIIAAIEGFQQYVGIPVDGKVDTRGATRLDLDRALPRPLPEELSAVTAARTAVRLAASRGLALTGPVGAVDASSPEDVRAIQRRLVELGKLPASHQESPPAGATTPVRQANLHATIAALREVQADVRFWVARHTVAGAITAGVAAPGDATAAFLDRVTVYTATVGADSFSFRDHIAVGSTRAESGVMFVGTASPSAISMAEYRGFGLNADEAAALKFVSTHEGNFDAVNTYDRAQISVGFIQFAGSRGLPGYLALLKARRPVKFADLLQRLGIDVEFIVAAGAIAAARVVVLDPAGSSVLRAAAAEAAIREDKKLTAAFVAAGRDREVQLTQIEAAVRDYVSPALNGTVSWAPRASARLGVLLRSRKGMAALFDRSIQEGVGAARQRFERVIRHLVSSARDGAPATVPEIQRREGDVLAELERDLQAASDVADRIARARGRLEAVIAATSVAGASLTAILARPELSDARRAVTDARTGLSSVVNVTSPRGVTVDAAIATMGRLLASVESRLALTPGPPTLADLATVFSAARRELASAAGPVSTAPAFLARIQSIRRSTLDSGLRQ